MFDKNIFQVFFFSFSVFLRFDSNSLVAAAHPLNRLCNFFLFYATPGHDDTHKKVNSFISQNEKLILFLEVYHCTWPTTRVTSTIKIYNYMSVPKKKFVIF